MKTAETGRTRRTPLAPALERALARTTRRVRIQRALKAGSLFAIVGVSIAALAVALAKTDALDERSARLALIGAAIVPWLGALIGALRPVAPLLAATLLDRAHRLHDRIANAASFASLPESERSDFMRAAIEDASAHGAALDPRRAMPLRIPRDLGIAVGLALGVGLLVLLEVPRPLEARAVARGIVPVTLHEDDLEAFDSELRELLDDPETPEDVRHAAREFNRLIEDLADERLDRTETLRRIEALEQRLEQTSPADAELLRESLRQLGADMQRAPVAEDLSRALQEGDAERAEAEMRRLAERLRTDPPSRAELDRLRQALARAAQNQPRDRSDELRQREEEMQRLLQRQREQNGAQNEQERRLLQRRQRELERLRRDHQQATEQRRQLERLQRELQQAAESLHQQAQDQAAQNLDEGAQDLNRMAQQQMSQEEMQRMQQQLAELRELIRRMQQQQQQQAQNGGQGPQQRQGQGGSSRMDRFVLRARGQGDGQGMRVGARGQGGQGGQPQPGGNEGQQGQQGQNGQGQEEQMLVLGGQGGNAVLEIPGMGQRPQPGGQTGSGQRPGPGAGVGHDETMLDDPTRLGGTRQTVRVEGEQQDQGPSRSEVILSSAERGFASRRYREVYTEYSGHAEEVLERDEVPPGYRFYVRRYFQLIRPRDGQ